LLPFVIWDTVWKFIAIRRAVQLKQYKMIPVLALANTAGILPIAYVLRSRGAEAPDEREAAEADFEAEPA
ncbi:MAG: hypothetical protein IH609_20075, partial [Dehalococcoidia bacterium]|nr:hypothetical protein [Dehalococcoidia bacterium]